MLTIGIDLATQNRSTAACRVEWVATKARVHPPQLGEPGEDNTWLIDLLSETADEDVWAAIDAPFGWPVEMVKAVSTHARREPWPAPTKEQFRLRLTDRVVQVLGKGIQPLSVSSDRIAVTAWRCAALLDGSRADLAFVRRTGEDRIVEAYPGAALKVWSFAQRNGYKGGSGKAEQQLKKEQRERLLREIEERAGGADSWLEWEGDARSLCLETDHALDALLSAFVARATATGRTTWPRQEQLDTALVEGWIHLPTADCFGSLPREADAW